MHSVEVPFLVLLLLLLLLVHHRSPVPILPFTSLHLDRPAAQPALVHLPNGPGAILGIHDADEAVSARFVVGLVPADLRHDKTGIPGAEGFYQVIVPEILGKISNKQPKVVLWPLREGFIDPRFARSRSLGRFGSPGDAR